MEVPQASYPVDIFTAHYRISGEFRVRGNPTVFLNNEMNQTLTIYEATVVPLRPGVELEPMYAPALYLPKEDPQALVLGNLTLETIKPLPRRELLVCLTTTFVMKGYFHLGMEARMEDVFTLLPQPFVFASNLQIGSLYAQATGVRANAMMAFVHKRAVRAYYVPEPEAPSA